MSEVSIAVITPTLNRPTLPRAIQSVLPQLAVEDELFVIGDGPQPGTAALVKCLADARVRYLEHDDPCSTFGNAAMRAASADYFMFLDDDDLLLPGALDAVCREGHSGMPLMFKMDYRPEGSFLWKDRVVREANVAGPMFVVPNVEGRWSEWLEPDRPSSGVLHFIQQTLALWPAGSLRWCDQVIYLCEKHAG